MLPWIGTALLAASWLFGLGYYHQPAWAVWAVLVVLGSAALGGFPTRARRPAWHWALAGLLLIPAAAFSAWPLRAAFVIGLVGCAAGALARVASGDALQRVLGRAASAGSAGGAVLAGQGLVLHFYEVLTSRSHELPAPMPRLIGAVADYLGATNGVAASTVTLFTMREQHQLGATWELLADPVSVAFLSGGLILLAWRARVTDGERWRRNASLQGGALMVLMGAWLPLRCGLIMGLFLTSALRTEYEAPLNSVHWLWNGWLHLVLLAMPVLALSRFLPLADPRASVAPGSSLPPPPAPVTGLRRARGALAAALAAAFVAGLSLTLAVFWDPPGVRRQGRVLIEEYHPEPDKVWERCDKPYDTSWYGHEAGYNYYCIKDYLDHFYRVERLTKPITVTALRDCDVLILKTPTRPFYSPEEILCIKDFVERGGGLLVIGEHTDVFQTSSRLHPVTALFGFRFRNDCLFGVDSVFEQRFVPPRPAHPIVQSIEAMDFATSCSLDVGWSRGRAPIRSVGLKNKTADYHVNNYYPVPSDSAKMRYGAFIQLWSARYGRGRVVAFTDSTIFSNFAVFEPGKAELMMGMVEWLNHRPPRLAPWPWLAALGLAAALTALRLLRGPAAGNALLLAAALAAGWAGGGSLAGALHRAAMPLPAPRPDRPLVLAAMDQTLSGAVLPRNGFISGKQDGFGIFERWILRLGYFTARRQAPATFAPDVDLLVIAYPRRPVPEDYRRRLQEFLLGGGRVLVLDSARNETSTANDLLRDLGVTLTPAPTRKGLLHTAPGWEPVPVEQVCRVEGGAPFAWVGPPADSFPVGVAVRKGQGTLVVVGFGDRFCDLQMGYSGDVEPDEALRKVFAVEFNLIRALVQGEDLTQPATRPPESAPPQ